MATTGTTSEAEVEHALTPFRLSIEQYQRASKAGIFGEPGRVTLVDGSLVESADGSEWLLTADQVVQMLDAEVFEADEEKRFTLWEGRLVERMSKDRPHCFSAYKLNHFFFRHLPDQYHVEVEVPMLLGERSLPEPDLIVIRGTIDDFRVRTPSSSDVALIVEVADSSVRFDSGAKLRAYASRAVPVYWIVNIPRSRVEVHSQPNGSGGLASYDDLREYGPGEEVPVVLDGVEVGRVAVSEILP